MGRDVCAPSSARSKSGRGKKKATCLADADLEALGAALLPRISNKRRSDPADLLAQLHSLLGPDESSWAEDPRVLRRSELRAIFRRRFKPERPAAWQRNQRAWLSTDDIDRVLKQYGSEWDSDSDFMFLGVFPRDFAQAGKRRACLATNRAACAPPVAALAREGSKIKSLGAVFNIDKHTQLGSHWVACFVSLDASRAMYGAYYYDPVARPPPEEIAEWMVAMQDQMLASGHARFELSYNRERRQFHNTECGIFAIKFLTDAIGSSRVPRPGVDFKDLCRGMGDDDDMQALRSVFYR